MLDLFYLENSRDMIFKVSLIDPGYFFSEKYLKNAGIEREALLIRVYPEQTKVIDWPILRFHCSTVLFSMIYEYMQNPFYQFSYQVGNLIPLSFVQDNSASNKANLTKFSELTLQTSTYLGDELKKTVFCLA